MAERLNKKLVAGLTITAMVLTTAAGVLMLVTLAPKKDPTPFVIAAEQAAEKENYEEAAANYARAWQRARAAAGGIDNEESLGYLLLKADMDLQAGNARQALGTWDRIVTSDPSHEVAQEKVVDFWLELARMGGAGWQRVQTEAEKLLAINEANYNGQHALGLALIRQQGADEGNLEKGAEYLISAFNGDPSNPDFAHSLGMYYFRESEADPEKLSQAIEVYDTNLETIQDSGDEETADLALAWRHRGEFFLARRAMLTQQLRQAAADRITPQQQAELEEQIAEADKLALQSLEKAAELQPEDPENLIALGFYWNTKQSPTESEEIQREQREAYLEQAAAAYKQAVEAEPEAYAGYLRLAGLYTNQMRIDDAIQVLESRMERQLDRKGYLAWRNKRMMMAVRNEAFRLHTAAIERLSQEEPDRYRREALREKYLSRMEEIYRDTAADAEMGEQDPVVLLMEARLAALQGDRNAAIDALLRAKKASPGVNLEVSYTLANLLSQDQPGAAEEELRRILEANPSHAASRALLASLLARMQRFNEAEVEAQRVLATHPNNSVALRTLAQIYEHQQNFEMMKTMQQRLAQLSGEEGQTRDKLVQAMILRAQAENSDPPDEQLLSDAEALLREILQANPSDTNALRQLAGILLSREDNHTEAIELLSNASKNIESQLTSDDLSRAEREQLEGNKRYLEVLMLQANPDISDEEKLAKREELIKQDDDPFVVAFDLYNLYRQYSDRRDEAVDQLERAYELAQQMPESTTQERSRKEHRLRGVVEMLFDLALADEDWELAERLVDEAAEHGADPADGHFYRGRLFMARQDDSDHLTKAEAEFREGIAAFPLYAQGHVLLGRALLGMNRLEEAEQAFTEAHRLNPRNAVAALALANLADRRGDAEQKMKYLEICEGLIPNHPWVRSQLAARQDLEDPSSAIARREEIRQSEPENIQNLIRLKDLYVQSGQREKAKEIFSEAVALAPDNLGLVQEYANFLRSQDPPDYPTVHEMLQQVRDGIDPEEDLARAEAQLLVAANLEMWNRQDREDKPTLKEVEQAFLKAGELSKRANPAIEIANHYRRQGNFEQLEHWLNEAAKRASANDNPNDERRARYMLISVMLANRDPQRTEDLKKEIEAYRERFNDPFGLLAMSGYYSIIGRETQALDYMDRYISANPSDPHGYLNRGNINLRRSQYSLAIDDFQKVKSLSPGGFQYEPRRLLALCYQNTGKTDMAINELSSVLKEAPNASRVFQDLFSLLLEHERFAQAEELILPRLSQQPNNPYWPMRMADVLTQRAAKAREEGRQAEAGEYVDRAIRQAIRAAELDQMSPRAVSAVTQTFMRFERYDELIQFSQTQLPDAARNHPQVLSAIAAAQAEKGEVDQAMSTYTKALDVSGDTIPLALGVIENMKQHVGVERTRDLIEQRLEAQKNPLTSRFAMVLLNRDQERYDEVIKSTNELLDELEDSEDPQAGPARMVLLRTLGNVYHKQDNLAKERETYERMLEVNPDHMIALNNLAYLLMERLEEPEAALPYAEKALEIAPNEALVLDTYGWNLVLLGQYDAGIATLREALGINPSNPVIHYHVAKGLHLRGQENDLDVDLKEASLECERAHELIMKQGSDPSGILPDIVRLGNDHLGLSLSAELPAKVTAAN